MSTRRWAVLWDLAGVLVAESTHNPLSDAAKHGLAAPIWRETLQQYLDQERSWDRVETGLLSLNQFVAGLAGRIQEAGGRPDHEALRYLWFGGAYPQRAHSTAILDLIRSWERKALVGIATNNVREYRALWLQSLPADIFEVIFDSSEIGSRKPQPEFFRCVEARLSGAVDSILLVDDRELNVAAARKLGWEALRYTGEDSLRKLPESLRFGARADSDDR